MTSSRTSISKPGKLWNGRFFLGVLLALGRLNGPQFTWEGSVIKQCVTCFRSDRVQQGWSMPLSQLQYRSSGQELLTELQVVALYVQGLSIGQSFCSQPPTR